MPCSCGRWRSAQRRAGWASAGGRDACAEASQLNTTITRDNEASWALFRSFARRMGGDLSDEAHYKRDDHFDGQHATEHMVTITLPDEGDLSSAA